MNKMTLLKILWIRLIYSIVGALVGAILVYIKTLMGTYNGYDYATTLSLMFAWSYIYGELLINN